MIGTSVIKELKRQSLEFDFFLEVGIPFKSQFWAFKDIFLQYVKIYL